MDLNERSLRALASGACAAMVVYMATLQWVLTPGVAAPPALFWTFVAVWIFGAVMLQVAPAFGAVGTALFGVVSAWGAWTMHRSDAVEDLALIVGSLAAAGLAAAAIVVRTRDRNRAAGP
ncbi:MAG TPA: hypothetical protein VI997_05325 [Candidatus Thermoplasmatota archaeon]|nr:hypothetical protein [Candidatus Thermoplasmatota archaeon]